MLRQLGIAAFSTLVFATMMGRAFAQLGEDRLYRSAYFLGRGDTGLSIADQEDAIFYNPAGLALGKDLYKKTILLAPQIEVSESTRDLARRIVVEESDVIDTAIDQVGKPNHVGVQTFTGLILRRAAIGAFASTQLDLLVAKSKDSGGLEVLHASGVQNLGATFSLAESFWQDALLLGVTGKYLVRGRGDALADASQVDKFKEDVSDSKNFYGYGQGIGADIGLQIRGRSSLAPAFGLTVTDVGTTHVAPKGETELDLDVKQSVNAGFSIASGTKLSKFRLLADVRDILSETITNPYKKLHLGGEVTVNEIVGFTTGLNQGYPTFGLYTDLYVLRVDVGAYTEEISDRAGRRPDKRFYFRLGAGF